MKSIVMPLIAIILLAGCVTQQANTITIGVVTDLTGPAAYWGESTRAGAEIAAKELNKEGVNVSIVFEDYQLDAKKALSSAQKLVNVDSVDAIYAEFNPAAVSVGSLAKDINMFFVYDAAPVSPLENAPYTYKTYLDYRAGCREISRKFMEEGVEKIGVLEVTIEFGQLCADGVKDVYGGNAVIEKYNLGDTDFRTQLLKISASGATAVINVGFEGDTLNTLRAIKELNLPLRYGTVDDTVTEQVRSQNGDILNGSWTFGFSDVDSGFKQKVLDVDSRITFYYGAALAYTHIKQIAHAIDQCKKNPECIKEKMDNSEPDTTIGFQKFENHAAVLNMKIKRY